MCGEACGALYKKVFRSKTRGKRHPASQPRVRLGLVGFFQPPKFFHSEKLPYHKVPFALGPLASTLTFKLQVPGAVYVPMKISTVVADRGSVTFHEVRVVRAVKWSYASVAQPSMQYVQTHRAVYLFACANFLEYLFLWLMQSGISSLTETGVVE